MQEREGLRAGAGRASEYAPILRVAPAMARPAGTGAGGVSAVATGDRVGLRERVVGSRSPGRSWATRPRAESRRGRARRLTLRAARQGQAARRCQGGGGEEGRARLDRPACARGSRSSDSRLPPPGRISTERPRTGRRWPRVSHRTRSRRAEARDRAGSTHGVGVVELFPPCLLRLPRPRARAPARRGRGSGRGWCPGLHLVVRGSSLVRYRVFI